MSFKSPELEDNVLTDKTCTDIFHKKKSTPKSKFKTKQKKNLKKQINKLRPSKPETKEPIAQVLQSRKIKQKTKPSINEKTTCTEKINTLPTSKGNKKLALRKKINKGNIMRTTEKLPLKIKKKLKRLENRNKDIETKFENTNTETGITKIPGLNIANLKKQLAISLQAGQVKEVSTNSLRERMAEKLKAVRFRFLSEQLYTIDGKDAQKLFQNDPDAFEAYHQGYRQQVSKWPLNPLDIIITAIKEMPIEYVIVDFGCGDGKLLHSVQQKVHSFDLVSTNIENIVACNMSQVPLDNCSVDVVVFCLSLMGTNLKDYLVEANRVLKVGGIIKIAEMESRFESIDIFIKGLQKFGFKHTWKDLSHNLFYFLDFVKERDIKNKNKLPSISLHPYLEKER